MTPVFCYTILAGDGGRDGASALLRGDVSSPGTGSRAKKTGHASEQDRSDVLKLREEWFDGQIDLDPNKPVFIDDIWAGTNMA